MKAFQFIHLMENIGRFLMFGLDKKQKDEEVIQKALDFYPEIFVLSPNHGGVIEPKYIILYCKFLPSGKIKSLILDPKSKVSYHYLISQDGCRTQFLPNICSGRHAGLSRWGKCVSLNNHSISIVFSMDEKLRELNEVEIDSCSKKCVDLIKKFKLQSNCILTHKMVSPNSDSAFPEESFTRILNGVESSLSSLN
jgi:N-acetyl-anhydromuramyl-L-alanine amidase AmpD